MGTADVQAADVAGDTGDLAVDERRATTVATGQRTFDPTHATVVDIEKLPQGILGIGAIVEIGDQLGTRRGCPGQDCPGLGLERGSIGIKGVGGFLAYWRVGAAGVGASRTGGRLAIADEGHVLADLVAGAVDVIALGTGRRMAVEPDDGQVVVQAAGIKARQDRDLAGGHGLDAGRGLEGHGALLIALLEQVSGRQNRLAAVEQHAGSVNTSCGNLHNAIVSLTWRSFVARVRVGGDRRDHGAIPGSG